MLKFIAKRLLQAIPVLLGIITIVFFVMRVFAPDPVGMLLGQEATPEKIEALREYWGLNDPLAVQYGRFLGQALTGDLGTSLKSRQPVIGELLSRLPATLELGLAALVFSVVVGVGIGVAAAVRQNSVFDRAAMFAGLIGMSMPVFWLGLMLIIAFGVNMGLLPISGRIGLDISLVRVTGFNIIDSVIAGNWAALASSVKHMAMPAFCIGVISCASFARLTRSTMLEVIRQDYVRTARSKGLRERTVIIKHALKNASIPIVTYLGVQLGSVVAGAVLTETVFSWPGVGTYMVNGINNYDYPVVQASALILAASFVLANLLTDILYGYLDPKIRKA
ncbi:MAG: ABC transporter permease [Clostridiales bacterium]|jgi:peptide/nickel transport system permease protein|nr:ABC transporter permease [Clostridiales bacterium]